MGKVGLFFRFVNSEETVILTVLLNTREYRKEPANYWGKLGKSATRLTAIDYSIYSILDTEIHSPNPHQQYAKFFNRQSCYFCSGKLALKTNLTRCMQLTNRTQNLNVSNCCPSS